jgi:predicted ABC-type ATPase
MPTCWIIAGPNGAGKTTFALDYLPQVVDCHRFINADLIAAGLSPLAPERQIATASRLFLREIAAAQKARESFAFETTLSGRGYLKLIRELRTAGWQVELIYLALPSVEMSRLRVAERVAHGGHAIPDVDLIRRFPRSLHNLLTIFGKVVNQVHCLLNAGPDPVLVFRQNGSARTIYHQSSFDNLQREAHE